jgi:hypothetical protein
MALTFLFDYNFLEFSCSNRNGSLPPLASVEDGIILKSRFDKQKVAVCLQSITIDI